MIADDGLCCCGCGEKTTVAKRTYNTEGIKKGEHRRFVRGHHNKIFKQNYKNGLMKNKGYVYVLCENHPNHTQGNYVKRSRLVMEEHLGRFLLSNEYVHHKNGIRHDDKIENLELTEVSEHNRIHKLAEKMRFGKAKRRTNAC